METEKPRAVLYLEATGWSMLVHFIACGLAPFLAVYSIWRRIDVLPYPFNLLHTHDNTLDGGQKQGYEIGVTGRKLWWQRTRWIWLNPGYGFDAYVLDFAHKGYQVISDSGPIPDFTKPSAFYRNVMQAADGKRYFTYRRNIPLFGDGFSRSGSAGTTCPTVMSATRSRLTSSA